MRCRRRYGINGAVEGATICIEITTVEMAIWYAGIWVIRAHDKAVFESELIDVGGHYGGNSITCLEMDNFDKQPQLPGVSVDSEFYSMPRHKIGESNSVNWQ